MRKLGWVLFASMISSTTVFATTDIPDCFSNLGEEEQGKYTLWFGTEAGPKALQAVLNQVNHAYLEAEEGLDFVQTDESSDTGRGFLVIRTSALRPQSTSGTQPMDEPSPPPSGILTPEEFRKRVEAQLRSVAKLPGVALLDCSSVYRIEEEAK